MFLNYLKTGLRNILKYKTFSFINAFGLAIAMTVCLLIILMLADQKSYDRFHDNKERIYRILSNEDHSKAPNAVTAFPLADALTRDYPIVEASTRLTRGVGGHAVYDDRSVKMRGYFTDDSFFKVFGFELQQGDEGSALDEPNSIVVASETARQLFRGENPIGKTVKFYDRGLPLIGDGEGSNPVDWGIYTITGVLAEPENKSHLQFDALISSSSLPALSQANKINNFTYDWQNYQSYTYARLETEKNQEDLNLVLEDLTSRQYSGADVPGGFKLISQKLTKITPGIIVRNEPSHSMPVLIYYFLGGLALVILISACLNYANLSIARAITRFKEIGVRKATGANKRNLVFQFLSESLISTFLALAIAVVLLFFIKPAFKSLWINQFLNFDLKSGLVIYLIFIGFAVLVGFMAGAYPAFHLSRFQPVKALTSTAGTRPGKLGARKALNIAQFVISLFFIVTSLLIYNQFRHYLEFEYGFNSENMINVPLQGNDHRKVAGELKTVPGVSGVSAMDIIPATDADNGIILKMPGEEDLTKRFNIIRTDENFTSNLDISLIAGRNLSPTALETQIVINKMAVETLGYSQPTEVIGKEFMVDGSDEALQVIGVVEDFRFNMLMNDDEIGPLVLRRQPQSFRHLNIKIASAGTSAIVGNLEDAWARVDASQPFRYEFYDDQLAASYRGILDVVSVLGYLALIAIVIACMGMLGMASYAAERRTKEVGIRKVMGAEESNIAFLLSKGFLRILLIAVIIGAPLSFFVNNLWLQYLPNRVDFGPGIVLLGSFILLTLGLIAIGSQTIRVSKKNPVDSLRFE